MPAAILDLTGQTIIEQGSGWKLILRYPGNVVTASFRGQIKANFGGETLATFRFQALDYDEDDDVTIIEMSLGSGETRRLPVPPANQFWRYDVVLVPNMGDRLRILQGRVFVSPGLTDI